LDKIIERAAAAEAPVQLREPAPARAAQTYAEEPRAREMPRREEPPRRRDHDDDDDYDRRPKKRRESFLSDIFDF
jgi:Zn-finger nucleic acid-binding protein